MKKWEQPEISDLAVTQTKDTSRDPGHGYDHYAHDHHCTCGLLFDTWAEAQAHELQMSIDKEPGHNIGCNIITS